MHRYFDPSVQVSQPHRFTAHRAIRELPLSDSQKAALARYDAAAVAPEPFARVASAPPPSSRRFQGWRIP